MGFLGDVGKFFKKIGGTALKVLPGGGALKDAINGVLNGLKSIFGGGGGGASATPTGGGAGGSNLLMIALVAGVVFLIARRK